MEACRAGLVVNCNCCLLQSVGRTTGEEYEVDDALLDRAAQKQSQSHIESRQRQLAIIGMFCHV